MTTVLLGSGDRVYSRTVETKLMLPRVWTLPGTMEGALPTLINPLQRMYILSKFREVKLLAQDHTVFNRVRIQIQVYKTPEFIAK